MEADPRARPCIDCGEPTLNDYGRCRDCDIDHLMQTWPTCPGCGVLLYSDVARKMDPDIEQHEPRCAEPRGQVPR